MPLPFSTARAIVPAQNLLKQSQNQGETAVVYINTALTASFVAAPDGTNTACLLTDTVDGAPTLHRTRNYGLLNLPVRRTSGVQLTLSWFVKVGSMSWTFGTVNGGAKIAYFQLTGAGVVGATLSTGVTPNVTRVYDTTGALWGWRCEMTYLGASDGSGLDCAVGPASGDNGAVYTGSGTGTIAVWQMQVEQSNRAGRIAKTTTAIIDTGAPRNLATPNTRALNTWVPMEFSGCVLWLHAEKGITIATGVSNWADQSGAGNHATQATGGNQPAWVASGKVNGRPALRFNGTSSKLVIPAISLAAWTVALVHTVDSKQGFSGVMSDKSGATPGFVFGSSASTTVYAPRVIKWDGAAETGKTLITPTYNIPLPAKSYVYTSALTIGVDGVDIALSVGGTGWSDGLTIGNAAGAYVGMDLAEVIIWNRVLSATELVQLQKQMIASWGVRG